MIKEILDALPGKPNDLTIVERIHLLALDDQVASGGRGRLNRIQAILDENSTR